MQEKERRRREVGEEDGEWGGGERVLIQDD